MSICLLALASSIALTEYIMYSPIVSESSDDNTVLFSEDDSHAVLKTDKSLNANNDDAVANNNEVASVAQSISPIPALESSISNNNGQQILEIASGDTINSVLTKYGFSKSEVWAVSNALSKVFNLRNLKVGQKITIKQHKNEDVLELDGLEFKPEMRYNIVVSKDASGKFKAEKIEVPIKKVVKTASGVLSPKNPIDTMISCGVKGCITKEALRVINQVVNVKSSKSPVNFEFLYKDFYDNDGNIIASPELVYASVLVSGKIFRVYKFRFENSVEYVDSNGVTLSSMAKSRSMLAKPLPYMKITSGYGARVHPIHGSYKRHTGVDLKASIGTPIYAAADGKIVKACYYSGYGKYVRIKHAGAVDTAYGHLSRISVRPGQHVRQGQVIGFVGVTGTTTGPHLHYEVLKNGRFINPMTLVKQNPQKLTGKKMIHFCNFKKQVNLQVVGLTPSLGKKVNKIKKFS